MLILDEPTSSLDADEVAELFRVIRSLKADGVAILFVSHFLDQVYEISDRLTVLRNGTLVGEYLTDEILRIDLVQKMIGKELTVLDELETARRARRRPTIDRGDVPFIQAIGLGRKGAIEPVRPRASTRARSSGLAGLLGSGRTELARLLSGIDRADAGELRIARPADQASAPRARRSRTASSTPRRTAAPRASSTSSSVRDNIVARAAGRSRLVPAASRKKRQDELAAELHPGPQHPAGQPRRAVRNLSGGNQQKVLLARWLAIAPRLLILDEPTRGIDIGAKAEIQKLVSDLAENGMTWCSSRPSSRRCCASATASPSCATAAWSPTSRTTTSPSTPSSPSSPMAPGKEPPHDQTLTARHRLFWPIVMLGVAARRQPDRLPRLLLHSDPRRPPLRQPHRHPAQRRARP